MKAVHQINLAYYRKMFWHFNNLNNKNKEEHEQINQLLNDQLTIRIFCLLEDVVNSFDSIGYHKDSVLELLSEFKFYNDAETHFNNELEALQKAMFDSGWDPKCKVKSNVRSVGTIYQTLDFTMDFEASVEAFNKANEIYENQNIDGEKIIDNPSLEELNEYEKQRIKSM